MGSIRNLFCALCNTRSRLMPGPTTRHRKVRRFLPHHPLTYLISLIPTVHDFIDTHCWGGSAGWCCGGRSRVGFVAWQANKQTSKQYGRTGLIQPVWGHKRKHEMEHGGGRLYRSAGYIFALTDQSTIRKSSSVRCRARKYNCTIEFTS